MKKPDTWPGIPDWDGVIHFDSDCIVNGIPIKAGTTLVVAPPSPVWRWDVEKSEMVPYRWDDVQRMKRG